jgi:murein L,D-transpeptidase YcbB/YkuD
VTGKELRGLRDDGATVRRAPIDAPHVKGDPPTASHALESQRLTSAAVLSLQRLAGNAAVTGLIARTYEARKNPRVKFGSKGPAVADVHRKLNWIPNPQLSEESDAWADMETIGQVYHFQARHSLKPDGIVGPDTHDALEDWASFYERGWLDVGSS